jgi:hypothetical protein
MVLRLSEALHLPLRQSNELLLAAGFARVWAARLLVGKRFPREDVAFSSAN